MSEAPSAAGGFLRRLLPIHVTNTQPFFSKMEELQASHDAMKLERESSHTEQLESMKQQYEQSLEGQVHTVLLLESE